MVDQTDVDVPEAHGFKIGDQIYVTTAFDSRVLLAEIVAFDGDFIGIPLRLNKRLHGSSIRVVHWVYWRNAHLRSEFDRKDK